MQQHLDSLAAREQEKGPGGPGAEGQAAAAAAADGEHPEDEAGKNCSCQVRSSTPEPGRVAGLLAWA